jgi:hypothetical protein
MASDRKAPERKPPANAGKADPEQSARFIEGARELGCEENLWKLDEVIRRIARAKPLPRKARKQEKTENP